MGINEWINKEIKKQIAVIPPKLSSLGVDYSIRTVSLFFYFWNGHTSHMKGASLSHYLWVIPRQIVLSESGISNFNMDFVVVVGSSFLIEKWWKAHNP